MKRSFPQLMRERPFVVPGGRGGEKLGGEEIRVYDEVVDVSCPEFRRVRS
jgi:hypothetical protein